MHQGFGSGRHRLHGVARRREHLNEPGAVFGFIFNNENERSARHGYGGFFFIHDIAGNLGDPRQDRIEDTAFLNRAVHAHLSSLRFHDSFCERQAQTGAGVFFGAAGIKLLELDKKPADIVRFDAHAAVFHLDAEVILVLGFDPNNDLSFVGSELEGIG